jgi:ketosteroid isomerase-like protein
VSQHDVQLVREGFLAASSGDPVAAQATFDPSIEWDMSGVVGWAEQHVYRGHEVMEFLRAWADSWREWHFDLEVVRDAAGDDVFVAIHEWGIGVDSGVSVDQHRYFAVTVRGGRIVRARMFSDRGDAIEAAGLPALDNRPLASKRTPGARPPKS